MKKQTYLKEIQKRLPQDIFISDETNIDFTEDEFVCILFWIKIYNKYPDLFGTAKHIQHVFISKRIQVDFSFHNTATEKGEYLIYITLNKKITPAGKEGIYSLRELIHDYHL